ncbi:hypothetical protein BDM02DRAFT_3097917 [Thelephora ganbajun]|uniref:Uncharacterized protein n=1 Tax=Thelephora ganbajun TaxID=370292 RepID=A0ACB6ZDY4_THEGA|nr:hypothetical protein BDM02DRAFT_3097917 [Thelephora ganbajun]
MAFWPADSRENVPEASKYSRKKARWEYPSVTEGSLTATTLVNKDGKFEWTHVLQDKGLRVHPRGKSNQIFPITRSLDPWMWNKSPVRHPEASVRNGSDPGYANFLRKAYPDVDITATLLASETAEDAKVLNERQTFDPHAGNTLEVLYRELGPRRCFTCLAFPMGDSGRQLNVSAFSYSKKDKLPIFRPTSKPLCEFPTPILQLDSLKSSTHSNISGSLLIVRTMGYTSISSLQYKLGLDSLPNIMATEVTRIHHMETGGRPIVDARIFNTVSGPAALAINDEGTIFQSSVMSNTQTIYPIYQPSEVKGTPMETFGRLVVGTTSTCYVVSSYQVQRLDLRVRVDSSIQPLWSLPTSERTVITSAELPLKGQLSNVVTTEGIYWFDERYPGKPVLGIKHYRDFDRTLEARTVLLRSDIQVDSQPMTFLTSRKTGLVSVYDVSRGEDDLVHMNAPSHCLSSITPHNGLPIASWNLFQHPLMEPSHIDILHLSSRGDINRLHAQLHSDGDADPSVSDRSQGFVWNDDVKELESANPGITGSDRFTERESCTVNLGSAYQDLFFPSTEEDENADATYDALDRLPSFWQNLDAPVDHIMTINDIACRLGDDPPDTHRADFLTPNPITGKRGYRAWKRGRISPQEISRGSNWNFDLTGILKSSTPDFSDEVDVMMNEIQSHSLLLSDNRTKESLKLENDACEQLALDLGMASHVYASKPFSKPGSAPLEQAQTFEDVVADMSLATGALSINVAGPPPVHFGFFTPITTRPVNHNPTNAGPEQPGTPQIGEAEMIPLGVRSLMDEWKVGEDPKDYKYFDPYGDDTPNPTEPKHSFEDESLPIQNAQSQSIGPTPRLNPPAVVASRAPPLIAPSKAAMVKEREKTLAGGGFTQDNPIQAQEPSQDVVMASTQVEPGRFGDRKMGQKKRQKRVGGF